MFACDHMEKAVLLIQINNLLVKDWTLRICLMKNKRSNHRMIIVDWWLSEIHSLYRSYLRSFNTAPNRIKSLVVVLYLEKNTVKIISFLLLSILSLSVKAAPIVLQFSPEILSGSHYFSGELVINENAEGPNGEIHINPVSGQTQAWTSSVEGMSRKWGRKT